MRDRYVDRSIRYVSNTGIFFTRNNVLSKPQSVLPRAAATVRQIEYSSHTSQRVLKRITSHQPARTRLYAQLIIARISQCQTSLDLVNEIQICKLVASRCNLCLAYNNVVQQVVYRRLMLLVGLNRNPSYNPLVTQVYGKDRLGSKLFKNLKQNFNWIQNLLCRYGYKE